MIDATWKASVDCMMIWLKAKLAISLESFTLKAVQPLLTFITPAFWYIQDRDATLSHAPIHLSMQICQSHVPLPR